MRILQISSSRTYGGGERHFVDLCRGLNDAGHDVFAAVRPTNVWEAKLDFLSPGRRFHISIRNSVGILSASRLAAFARENEIDIIHAHVARDYIPASIACALTRGSTKFVLTRHVMFPLKSFNRIALKNLSKAIAVSSGVEATLYQVFPKAKVVLIKNGIEVDRRTDEQRKASCESFRAFHGIPLDAPLIGTIGELVPLKGQRDLILAANETAKQFPDGRYIIVGRDNTIDQKYRRELKRMVKIFGLEDRFLWLDWVEDTAELFSALDVFVSASHTESFGMAMLEAIVTATPLVATDTDGARELIEDAKSRVPVNDPVQLADKICAVLSDPNSRRLAEDRALIARERFSLDRMVKETEQLYLEVQR
ncbi:MAG: glycosyltransferase family 4 protein [Acidobacteria bacterium]|nr:glycosyltransferase family 4 protein [Acidobacteriota bacterium]